MTKPQDELLRRSKILNYGFDDKNVVNMYDALLNGPTNSISMWPTIRLTLTVLSIGAGKMFFLILGLTKVREFDFVEIFICFLKQSNSSFVF